MHLREFDDSRQHPKRTTGLKLATFIPVDRMRLHLLAATQPKLAALDLPDGPQSLSPYYLLKNIEYI
jgi:hypothetical protein